MEVEFTVSVACSECEAVVEMPGHIMIDVQPCAPCLEKAQAEIARLRAALEEIEDCPNVDEWEEGSGDYIKIARQALQKREAPQPQSLDVVSFRRRNCDGCRFWNEHDPADPAWSVDYCTHANHPAPVAGRCPEHAGNDGQNPTY